jgi:hypothetical protein
MSAKTPRLAMVAAIFLLSLAALKAQGQTASDTAQAVARTAEVLASEGKHDEAIALFKRAYVLEPDAALLYNIGRLYDKKGDMPRAREYYERYISDEKDQDRLAKGRQRLQDVLDRIPGTLVIETDTPGAIVEVDGKPVAATRLPISIQLVRGNHEVVAKLEGRAPDSKTVVIPPGGEVRVLMALRPLPAQVTIRCPVRGTRVTVNSRDPRVTPIDRPFVVTPGHIKVEATADGYEKFTQEIEVAPGASVAIDAVLQAIPPKVVALPPAQPKISAVMPSKLAAPVVAAKVSPAKYSPWQWVTLGTGAAMVITGGVLTGLASKDRAKVDDAKTLSIGSSNLSGMTRADVLSLLSSADKMSNASIAMYSIGGAAIVTGVVLAILDAKRTSAGKPGAASVALSAGPVPGGAVVQATGRFW